MLRPVLCEAAGLDPDVQILRVHDVAETYQARAIWLAMGR